MHVILGINQALVATAVDENGRLSIAIRKKKHDLPLGEPLPEGSYNTEITADDILISFESASAMLVLMDALCRILVAEVNTMTDILDDGTNKSS